MKKRIFVFLFVLMFFAVGSVGAQEINTATAPDVLPENIDNEINFDDVSQEDSYDPEIALSLPTEEVCTFRQKTDDEYLQTLDYYYQLDVCSDFDSSINLYEEQELPFYEERFYYADWIIDNFHAVYHINEDATVDVDERIWTNFWYGKHGIYRYVPTKYPYSTGLYYDIKINFDTVVDEFDDEFNIYKKERSDPFYLQIGDPDVWEYGQNLYRIKYNVERGIRFFDDHDEFYWNVTGSDWESVILNSTASVVLPEGINQDEVKVNCYLGESGTDEQYCSYEWIVDNVLEFYSDDSFNIDTFDDFTIAIWLPKGVVEEPSSMVFGWWLATSNWGYGLPILIFIIAFYLWYRFGNDENLKKTIIAQYDENAQMSPLVAGMLMNNRAMSTKDISAELVYLAVRKYIKIREVYNDKYDRVTDHELIKLKAADDKLRPYQKYLLDSLFIKDNKKRTISSLNNSFYRYLTGLKQKTEEYTKQYYDLKPWVRIVYIVIAVALLLFSIIIGWSATRFDLGVGGAVSSIIIFIFAFVMPKMSHNGLDQVWHLKGLQKYIDVADRDRVKFYDEKNIFEKVLPYAMIFGMVDKWTQVFKDIYKGQPEWYESASSHPFNIASFAPIMTSFSQKTARTSRSVPAPQNTRGSSSYRSSGFSGGGFSSGGSSGGGFGGGGGGSW